VPRPVPPSSFYNYRYKYLLRYSSAQTCLVVCNMPPASRAACLLALTLAPHARSDMEMNCQIFDSTMVCDSDKPRIARGEIRTCSG